MISSITNRGRLAFMIFRQRFDGAGVPELSWPSYAINAEEQNEGVSDCGWAPSTQTQSVTRRLAEHGEQIRIFYLSSYSPELNPDELLNQDVKTNALGRVRPVNVQEMMDNVRSYLRITEGRPTVVKNYFCDRHVRYAAS